MNRAYLLTISPPPVSQTLALNPARFWRERPQEVILAGAAALVGLVVLGSSAASTPELSGLGSKVAEAPPAPPPIRGWRAGSGAMTNRPYMPLWMWRPSGSA